MSFSTEKYTKSAFLHGADLEEGERMIVTIKSAEEVTFPQSGDIAPVLEFLEIDQKLSLNKTRIRKLVEMFGNDPEAWIDRKISLYPVPVSFNGKPELSVAIMAAPSPKKEKATIDMPQPEVPFMEQNDEDGDLIFSDELPAQR